MNILLADKNIATCTLIAAYLRKIDPLAKVTFAMTEIQAINHAETGQFHLVMVDADLGTRSRGLTLIPKLEKFQKGAKLILLVVGQDHKVLGCAEEMGVACLSKPIDPNKLKAFLNFSMV